MTLLEKVREYSKSELSDEELVGFVKAAQIYLRNVDVETSETNELYRLAVAMLVTHWTDQRAPVIVGTVSKKLEYSLNSIIQQLRLS